MAVVNNRGGTALVAQSFAIQIIEDGVGQGHRNEFVDLVTLLVTVLEDEVFDVQFPALPACRGAARGEGCRGGVSHG